jgi:asparagine synthase (glutamine-hydrolysing)
MCGICGILSHQAGGESEPIVQSMARSLHHRGPDDEGVWADAGSGIVLGHRRLSILDLSPAGAQPMASPCGRFMVAFNGEIYNHLALRDALEAEDAAPLWRGHSDTETLLVAIARWGLPSTLRRASGMFAIALWDRQERTLSLARDRMGEKPLYLAELPDGWAFASEIKALLEVPAFKPVLCRDAIAAYLAYSYVPETLCIFRDVRKVAPGHIATLSLKRKSIAIEPYESFADLAEAGLADRANAPADPLASLETVLGDVVEEQTLSDVPLGCFLSGGVDSSLIASLMQSRATRKVRTFAIGFDDERFNEAPHAAAVARHLGTDHTEIILSERDALDVIPRMPAIYDEPFADSSQIPTTLLCREARRSVTVALTGDGGDEIFGGYNRHVIGPRLLANLQRVPCAVRQVGGQVVAALAPLIVAENGGLRTLARKMRLPITALDNVAKLAPHAALIDSLPALYQHLTRSVADPSGLLSEATKVADPADPLDGSSNVSPSEWMMAMDSVTYLPGDILVKVDRAAMAASLETRAPFLDARVVTAAWELPLELKIADGKGKQALRSILDRYVPRDLIERPKQGFAIPLDRWLRGALRQWGESLLCDEDLVDLAGLKRTAIHKLWKLHQSGNANNGTQLWTILVLLDWLRHYRHDIVRVRWPDLLPVIA